MKQENGRVPATPAARRLARERGIPISNLVGSGPAGCIKAADVLQWKMPIRMTPVAKAVVEHYKLPASSLPSVTGRKLTKADVLTVVEKASATRTESTATSRQASLAGGGATAQAKRIQLLKGRRRVIAQRMLQSLQVAAQHTMFADYDMTRVLDLYKSLIPVMQQKYGVKLTITDLLVKMVAHALEEHPDINSSIVGDEIVYHDEINIGVAVDAPEGLIVPVLRNANRKTLPEIMLERHDLVTQARAGRIYPDYLVGGTFTISNIGMYPVDYCTPIINQPESGILGVGRIVDTVLAIDGEIEVRPVAGVSLTLDHRNVDGGAGARFLATLKKYTDNPVIILV